jgi:hypothetical protein
VIDNEGEGTGDEGRRRGKKVEGSRKWRKRLTIIASKGAKTMT